MEQNNVLFLDEPTNDLDIGTLQVLEDYLEHFPGPVVAVSHDRYFLDRITTSILAYEEGGNVKLYAGDFTSYLEKRPDPQNTQETPIKKESVGKQKTAPKLKFTYKEQQEYSTIEEEIAYLEDKVAKLEKDMAANATSYSKLVALTEERDQAQAELDQKYARWEELEEKQTLISQQS